MGSVLAIPGYQAALEREALVRDASFLPVTETVAGFECVPMTLRHFITLRMMRSPFLFGTTPSPEDIAAFLWLLSPAYKPGTSLRTRWNRRRLIVKTAAKLSTATGAAKLVHAIRDYVEDSLQDMQPIGEPVGCVHVAHFSDAAAMCASFGREFGWAEEAILQMPMKRLLQYTKEMRTAHGGKTPLCNPSDRVRSEWMETLNKGGRCGA
jgi:hypothetical protein